MIHILAEFKHLQYSPKQPTLHPLLIVRLVPKGFCRSQLDLHPEL
jgi:hypothetical protein